MKKLSTNLTYYFLYNFMIILLMTKIANGQDNNNLFLKLFHKSNDKKIVLLNLDIDSYLLSNIDDWGLNTSLQFVNFKIPFSFGYRYLSYLPYGLVKFPSVYFQNRDKDRLEREIRRRAHSFQFFYPVAFWIGDESVTLTGAQRAGNVIYYHGVRPHHRYIFINSFVDYQLNHTESNIVFKNNTLKRYDYSTKQIVKVGFDINIKWECVDAWYQPSYALNSGAYNYNHELGIGLLMNSMKAEFFIRKDWDVTLKGIRLGYYLYDINEK